MENGAGIQDTLIAPRLLLLLLLRTENEKSSRLSRAESDSELIFKCYVYFVAGSDELLCGSAWLRTPLAFLRSDNVSTF